MGNDWVTIDEACNFTQVTRKTLHNWRKKNKIKTRKDGSRVMVYKPDLEEINNVKAYTHIAPEITQQLLKRVEDLEAKVTQLMCNVTHKVTHNITQPERASEITHENEKPAEKNIDSPGRISAKESARNASKFKLQKTLNEIDATIKAMSDEQKRACMAKGGRSKFSELSGISYSSTKRHWATIEKKLESK